MRKKFIITGALLALLGFSAASPAMAASDFHLIINNQLFTQHEELGAPCQIGDRAYVPLRLVGQSLGHEVHWVEHKRQVQIVTDSPNQQIVPDDGVAVPEDAPISIYIDGKEIYSDAWTGMPYISEAGRTMVPLRLVGESLNCNVHWQEGLIVVTEKQPEPEVKDETSADEEEEEVTGYHTLTIQGRSIATADQLNAFLEEKEPEIRRMMERQYPELGFTPFPEDIAELYIEIGKKYNIRGDLAFAQALKETGYFQFYGQVQPFQNNFCGLGATGTELTGEEPLNGVDPDRAAYIPGMHGITFTTVADGVEAHIQHLYAYATDEDLPAGCELVDPRFKYVKRGIAERWIDLNGRWAVPGNGYGQSIIDSYWMPAFDGELPPMN